MKRTISEKRLSPPPIRSPWWETCKLAQSQVRWSLWLFCRFVCGSVNHMFRVWRLKMLAFAYHSSIEGKLKQQAENLRTVRTDYWKNSRTAWFSRERQAWTFDRSPVQYFNKRRKTVYLANFGSVIPVKASGPWHAFLYSVSSAWILFYSYSC